MSIPPDPRLPRSIIAFIQQEIRQSLQPFTNNLGQIDFTKGNGFSGTLAYPNGGTNNQLGQAVPKDDSVTDIKVAVGANIDPAKLDTAKLTEEIEDIVGAFVVAGAGISVTYDDAANALTIAFVSGADYLDAPLSNGLEAAPDLIFIDGEVIVVEVVP